MKRVGVPRTAPDAMPLSTSRRIPEDAGAGSVVVEACGVEPELGGIPLQIVFGECELVMKEQLVHVPEPVLECRCLGCGRHGEGVRVDLGEREMPEGEADTRAELSLDAFDFSERSPRVRAFVVAVLEDDTADCRTADVIDFLVKRLAARTSRPKLRNLPPPSSFRPPAS